MTPESETYEKWKDIDGYFGRYSVSTQGNVRSNLNKKLLSPHLRENGYLEVALCRGNKQRTFLVHRLVAKAFLPNPKNKPQVNHINGNRADARLSNLEWCTAKENRDHAVTVLNHSPGKHCKQILCLNTGEVFDSIAQAARAKNVSRANITSVVNGHRVMAGGFFWISLGATKTISSTTKGVGPVLCIETGEAFKNTTEAQRKTGIKSIADAVSGRYRSAGGFHWVRLTPEDFYRRYKEGIIKP